MTTAYVLANFGGPQLLVVLAILLILFGGSKLPELARSFGSAQREFRKGLAGDDDDSGSSQKSDDASQNSSQTARDSEASGSES